MLLGYDTVFKARTQLKALHRSGNLVGYKSATFSLFKTVKVELNDALDGDATCGGAFRDASKTDDVGA